MNKRLALIAVAGLAAGTWIACSRDAPTSTRRAGSAAIQGSSDQWLRGQISSTQRLRAQVSSTQRLSAEAVRRIEEVKPQVAWVGRIHNAAMRDLVQNREVWVGSDGHNMARVCAGLARLVTQYRPSIEAQAGVHISDQMFRKLVRAGLERAKPDCAGISEMSLFGSLAPVLIFAQSGDSDVTGAYESYVTGIQNGVGGTDGTPGQVNPVTAAVVESASSIPWADFQLVASVASFTDSSSAFAAQSGGGGGGGPMQQSLFASRNHQLGFVLVVLADLGGCAIGMGILQAGGVTNSWALAIACVVTGALASGAVIMMM